MEEFIMTGYIKGYDIISISKKRSQKISIGTKLSELVSDGELRAQMLDALESGGKVYALRKKKELYACCIFRKTERNADDFMTAERSEKLKSKDLSVYELVYEYRAPETDGIAEKIKDNFLAELKEQAAFYDCKAIIWNNDYYVPASIADGRDYRGFLIGLAIGAGYAIIFDNWCLGIALGVLFSQTFGWAMYSVSGRDSETEDGEGAD